MESFIKILYEMEIVKSKREKQSKYNEAMGNSYIKNSFPDGNNDSGVFAIFVKWTLSETSLGILEEKIENAITDTPIILEEGSVVKNDELESFYLFSGEKRSFEEFILENKQNTRIAELKELPGLLQINQNIEIKNLLSNDCEDVYCYQHYISFDYIPSIFWKGLNRGRGSTLSRSFRSRF